MLHFALEAFSKHHILKYLITFLELLHIMHLSQDMLLFLFYYTDVALVEILLPLLNLSYSF